MKLYNSAQISLMKKLSMDYVACRLLGQSNCTTVGNDSSNCQEQKDVKVKFYISFLFNT